jgi:ribosomal protein S18 acetylase RimI-like enzyme
MKTPGEALRRRMNSLRPIGTDRAGALDLARRAVRARRAPGAEAEDASFLSAVERDVASGAAEGVMRVGPDGPLGIALWQAPAAIGRTVVLMYLVEGHQTVDEYGALLAEARRSAGPIAFAPGALAGLSDEQEDRAMRAAGFARFGRSEMRFPPDRPPPEEPVPDGGPTLRDSRPDDRTGLARLHAAAYGDTFDRYLYQVDPDPVRDAEIATGEILDGRWGEFLPWASPVADRTDRLVAASLVVRAPYGPLIADVMVDPGARGRGLGRAVLGRSIRALRAHGEAVIVLNVTEGNARALRLYEGIGFVRSLGPSHGWYSTDRIPVSPEVG